MDGDSRRPRIRRALAAPRAGGGLRKRGRERKVRPRLRCCMGQSHEPRSVRSVTVRSVRLQADLVSPAKAGHYVLRLSFEMQRRGPFRKPLEVEGTLVGVMLETTEQHVVHFL